MRLRTELVFMEWDFVLWVEEGIGTSVLWIPRGEGPSCDFPGWPWVQANKGIAEESTPVWRRLRRSH